MLSHIAEEFSGHGTGDQQADDCLCEQGEILVNLDRALTRREKDGAQHRAKQQSCG